MELFIGWCGFIGSWLLVAGPLYQAALELHDEDLEVERIQTVKKELVAPPRISVWWWLLPPVKIILSQRQSQAYRKAYLAALAPEDVGALISFMSKAFAWMFVAAGGFLLAVKETYELVGLSKFPVEVFWIAIVLLPILAVGNVISQMSKTRRLVEPK